MDSQVSAHLFMRRDGALLQFVSCDARVARRQVGLPRPVCAAIAQHYPIAHVAGHEHIAPGRKKDPGENFDGAMLRRELGWDAGMFPARA